MRRGGPVSDRQGWNPGLVLGVQALLLAWAGWQNRFNLNTDAIAYLRLASYYAEGSWGLAVSGYWGPLISWLMAPMMAVGLHPLTAGRLVMGFSALVFSVGSHQLLRRLDLPPRWERAGLVSSAAMSVLWSVQNVTPDLLLAGLVCLAVARLMTPEWTSNWRAAIKAGMWWGLAYYAKAVALPLAVGCCLCLGIAWFLFLTDKEQRRPIGRQCLITLAACALAVLPWTVLLSAKYHRITFSTTARIAHAVVGPADQERYHPFGATLHQPEKGRLTSWEDPSRMDYRYWSPFQSAPYFRHQLGLLVGNLSIAGKLVASLDVLHSSIVALVAAGCLAWHLRKAPEGRWTWTSYPALCLAGIYSLVYLSIMDLRYFYALYAPAYAAAIGMVLCVFERWCRQVRLDRIAPVFISASFFLLAAISAGLALTGVTNSASLAARDLAGRIKSAGLAGPVAGNGLMEGHRAGLYTAFWIGQPWHGDSLHAAAADYRTSGASLIVLNRRQSLAAELDQDPAFRNLDEALFGSAAQAELFPLKVFQAPSHL